MSPVENLAKLLSKKYNTYISPDVIEFIQPPVMVDPNTGLSYIEIKQKEDSRYLPLDKKQLYYNKTHIKDLLKDVEITPDEEQTLYALLPRFREAGIELYPTDIDDVPLPYPHNWTTNPVRITITAKNESLLYYGVTEFILGEYQKPISNTTDTVSSLYTVHTVVNKTIKKLDIDTLSLEPVQLLNNTSVFNNDFEEIYVKDDKLIAVGFVSATYTDTNGNTVTATNDNIAVFDIGLKSLVKTSTITGTVVQDEVTKELYTIDHYTGTFSSLDIDTLTESTIVALPQPTYSVLLRDKVAYVLSKAHTVGGEEQLSLYKIDIPTGTFSEISTIKNYNPTTSSMNPSFSPGDIAYQKTDDKDLLVIRIFNTTPLSSDTTIPQVNGINLTTDVGTIDSGVLNYVVVDVDGAPWVAFHSMAWAVHPTFLQEPGIASIPRKTLMVDDEYVSYFSYRKSPDNYRLSYTPVTSTLRGVIQNPVSKDPVYWTKISDIVQISPGKYLVIGKGQHKHGGTLSTTSAVMAIYTPSGEIISYKIASGELGRA